jgi:hypothetical protein
MNTIIRMNNNGAYFIETGHYADAIQMLSGALQTVEGLWKKVGETNDETSNEMEPSSTTLKRQHRSLNKSAATVMARGETIDSYQQPFIYQHPIRLLREEDDDYLDLCIKIMFNLALSHHLNAISHNHSKKGLQVALKLYEVAFTMEMECKKPKPKSATSTKKTTILRISHAMGLVNNCGHILNDLKKERKANRLFQFLLQSLMMVVHCGEPKEIDELQGFLSSTIQVMLHSPPLASAA